MNILVIGNGFDLWHGLPTRYSDFVNFIKVLKSMLPDCGEREFINAKAVSPLCKDYPQFESLFMDFHSNRSCHSNQIQEIMTSLENNSWLNYFTGRNISNKNWTGFEGDIAKAINVYNTYHLYSRGLKQNGDGEGKPPFSDYMRMQMLMGLNFAYQDQLTAKLLNDLKQLIRCLEIYFCLCLDLIQVEKKLDCVSGMNTIDKVLSFNYTNTFERVYASCFPEKPEYCYIHGRASLTNSIDSNNMVLGIDEFLDPASRDTDLEYVGFKKYYQRILNQTDYNYTQWLKERAEKNIYVIGHSLDSTDQDVLRDLFLQDRFNNAEVKLSPDHVRIKVFYHSRKNNAAQIKNLVKVLGYDNLNALARGADLYRNIEFLPLE